jgi:hypothetical protein
MMPHITESAAPWVLAVVIVVAFILFVWALKRSGDL